MYNKPHSNFFTPEELRALDRMAGRLSEYMEEYGNENPYLEFFEEMLYSTYDISVVVNKYFDNAISESEMEAKIEDICGTIEDDNAVINLN